MEHTILKDIVIIFALSTFVNLLFTRLKIPTVVGYLMTGFFAGPHLLGLVDSVEKIDLLAEMGVVLLLFSIGMEFSLQHLIKIRRVVLLGGLIQVSLTVAVFYVVSKFYGMSPEPALFMGFLIALSSSALVLKLLQERSELTSNYGRTMLGILIFQDLLLVPLLLFANILGGDTVNISQELLMLSLKAVLIIALVYVGNKWLLPKLLHLIAMTKNQELFMMSIFLFCFAVASLTFKMGMSLAFGAFLAGLMISRSEYNHNAFGNLIPFKNTFTSFFFVSIGMLLNTSFVIENYQLIILSVVLVIVMKTIIGSIAGFVLGHTLRGFVLIGLGLSQVGEFSFILAKAGFDYNILSDYYYQLFLAVTVITMALTPFLMNAAQPISNMLLKLPLPKFIVDGLNPVNDFEIPDFENHLVIIGKDSSAVKLSSMAKHNRMEHVSIIFDPVIAKEKISCGDVVVYGDAINEPILRKAHVDTADTVVISVGEIIASMAITEQVKRINSKVHVIVRTKQVQNVEQLYKVGADQVLPDKFEIAVNLFNRVLVKQLYPQREINRKLSHIRNMNLGDFSERDIVNKPSFLDELTNISISVFKVDKESPVEGKTVEEIDLRDKSGATLLAIKRGKGIIEHPSPDIYFIPGDKVFVLGNPEQTNSASEIFIGES